MRGHQEAYAPKVEGGVQVFWQDPLYEQGAHRFLLSSWCRTLRQRDKPQVLRVGSAMDWQQAEVTREGFLEEVGFS